MNNIVLQNTAMPIVSMADHLTAQQSFYHIDRTASFNVLIYVVSGTIYVTEEDVNYEVGGGEILLLKAGVRHYGQREISQGTEWYFVHFILPALADGPDVIDLPKKLEIFDNSPLALHIAELATLGDPTNRWYLNAKFFRILSEIAFYEQCYQSRKKLSDKICEYLSENFNSPFSAVALEEKFFLSYKHLAFVFKKEKNMTMQQFHTAVRMEKARDLLKTTVHPIGEISRMVGYSDMLYFSKRFRANTGMSPTEYRNLPAEY